jgi:hypothetical protein
MKGLLIAFGIGMVALAGRAHAATGARVNLVAVPPRCGSAGQCLNGAGACAGNAQCNVGSLSPKSLLTLDGKTLVVKLNVTGATDAAGNPLETDGIAGTADDYVLELDLSVADYLEVLCPISGCSPAFAALKVDFKQGRARLTANLSSLFPMGADGRPLRVLGGSLRRPPSNPADCPGDNSPAGLASRTDFSGCFDGAIVGMAGIEVRQ